MIRAARTLVLAVLVAATAAASAPAHADPIDSKLASYTARNGEKLCGILDTYPSFNGVDLVMATIKVEGPFTTYQAAEVLVAVAQNVCPKHWSLVHDYGSSATTTPEGPIV